MNETPPPAKKKNLVNINKIKRRKKNGHMNVTKIRRVIKNEK